MCVFKFKFKKYFGGFKLQLSRFCVYCGISVLPVMISRPNKQSNTMPTISFLSTKQTRIKMTTSNNNDNIDDKVDNNKIQLTITTGTTKIILDIVGTLTVSQVMNNSTAEAAAGVPPPASPSILSPPTKKLKNKDDNDADSIHSGSSTEYEEDNILPKMGSLKLNKTKNGKTKNGKRFTNPTTKKTSKITFDDDDYIEDNQFSQQHYW